MRWIRKTRPRAVRGGRRGRRRHDDLGQALIELVLVLPLLLLILFGLLEFANAWRVYQAITNTAREGARFSTLQVSTTQGVQDTVEYRLDAAGLQTTDPPAKIRLAICSEGGITTCTGQPDTVEVSYQFQFRMIGPIAELICGNCGTNFGSVTLFTRTVMRNE